MPAVRWSRRAEARLKRISATTRDQLVSNAEEILHDTTSSDFPHDEGRAGEIMWHRGIPCGTLSEELLAKEDDDGPWNYFLFYKAQSLRTAEADPGRAFEVLDICSVAEVILRWNADGRGLPAPEL